MYNIHYDICAILVLVAEIVLYYSRKNLKVGQNKIYICMIYLLFISTSCDLAVGIIANAGMELPVGPAFFVNTLYFVAHIALPMLFVIYNISMTTKASKYKRWMKTLFFTPYIIVLLLLISNVFTEFIFEINENGQYIRGPGMFLLYIAAIIYFLCTIIYVTKNSRYIEGYKIFCVYLFIAVISVPVALQTLYPYLLVEGFGEAICFLLIYASLEQRADLVDGVLGLYNKKAFVNFANINIKEDNSVSVMSVSVDDVDYLERNFGIECMAGLEFAIAEFLKTITSGFEIYHVGDYIFYIVDSETESDGEVLDEIAKKIQNTCTNNWMVGDVEIPVDMDICIIRCPEDVNSLEQIFDCTEYISNEEHGRGTRIVYANEFKSFYGNRKNQIRKAIQKAIQEESFQVYYQPIYSTKEGRVNSAEALVRLIDDELGFISPEEFIPIAEEDGSILKIGRFVLENVCRLIKENDIKAKGIEYIEVNVSVIECMKHNMASRVAGMINRYGLEPGQINLEITETAAMNSPEIVGNNMIHLVDYGVNFSLDDYGSGYSNINYLVELPFNLIKVDKNIVWSSFANEKAGIALASSIAMIRRLEYKIVAEGVETKEQADKLTEMGCEYLQGYYFSKPLPETDFILYISKLNESDATCV